MTQGGTKTGRNETCIEGQTVRKEKKNPKERGGRNEKANRTVKKGAKDKLMKEQEHNHKKEQKQKKIMQRLT